ncbi:hypothetical protein QQM41_11665 [Acetobacter sp. AC2005]|uniref:hypothetical protein n=1 Tax=Acetobacter sp. AC2005 TaxID=3134142 RepID=UPI0030D58EFC
MARCKNLMASAAWARAKIGIFRTHMSITNGGHFFLQFSNSAPLRFPAPFQAVFQTLFLDFIRNH